MTACPACGGPLRPDGSGDSLCLNCGAEWDEVELDDEQDTDEVESE